MNEEKLKQLLAEIIEADPAEISADTDLRTLTGFDSVNVLALMIALDEQMGVRLSPEQAAALRYFRDVVTIAREQGKLK